MAEQKENMRVYLNNPNLKAEGVELGFTKEQIAELKKCYDDPIYFVKTYCKIVNIDKGLIPFNLYPFQETIIKNVLGNRFCITKSGRQSGKSATNAAAVCHYTLFNEHKTVAILANKQATAKEILSRVQMMYEHLPKWMQVGVVSWNKNSFELANGCKVLAASTSSSAIRGCIHGTTTVEIEGRGAVSIESLFNELPKKHETVADANGLKIKTPTGWSSFSSIIRYESTEHRLLKTANREIRVSHNHPLLTVDGWKEAVNIDLGDKLVTVDGAEEVCYAQDVEESAFFYDPAYVQTGDRGRVSYSYNQEDDTLLIKTYEVRNNPSTVVSG